MWKKIKPYVISIAIALGVGALSGFVTKGNMDVYEKISKPALSPPGVVFPIVWGVLFVLMGISSARVYVKGKEEGKDSLSALFVYGVQLIANFLWSVIFFNLESYLFAFVWILVLLALIILMIKTFYEIDHAAAWLQVPYLLWVAFATYLTFMIYIMNR